MTNQIMQQKDKYNYSVKMGTARLLRQKILLPVDSSENPDYKYMENYIRSLMFKKYMDYLKFKKCNVEYRITSSELMVAEP